jgi:hypothetical protein
MKEADWQLAETFVFNHRIKVFGSFYLVILSLDGYLPCARCTHKNFVSGFRENLPDEDPIQGH